MTSHALLQQALTELSALIRTDFVLLDGKDRPVASTFDLSEEMRAFASRFRETDSESQSVSVPGGSTCHFFRLPDCPDGGFLLIARGQAAAGYTGGCIAASQVRFLLKAGEEQMNREQFLLRLITDSVPEAEMQRRIKQFRLSPDSSYSLILIAIDRFGAADIRTILQQLFVESSLDACLSVGDSRFALIRDLSRTHDPASYPERTAPVIADTLSSEAMVRFHIAYSAPARSLTDLRRAYRESSLALDAGGLFFPERQIIPYHTLGIGKLIYQLPLPLCRSFARDIFGEQLPVLDDELLSTVNRFFKNSLNISETARQLYLHRNTLVYRLERIQKMTGLDIRNFEDALTFRIAWMAASRIRETQEEASGEPEDRSASPD